MMRHAILPAILSLFFLSDLTPLFAETPAAPAKSEKLTYNPDIDLEKTPKRYRRRVKKFRNLLRREPSREAKIRKAMALAKNRRSNFRSDAVSFLGEVRALEATGLLIDLCKDVDVKEFALFSLGQLRSAQAIQTIINSLTDESDNVRGNAYLALQRISGRDFDYDYAADPRDRKKAVKEIRRWWKRDGANFTPPQQTDQEHEEAEEAWEKYGRAYLHDLTR